MKTESVISGGRHLFVGLAFFLVLFATYFKACDPKTPFETAQDKQTICLIEPAEKNPTQQVTWTSCKTPGKQSL